MDKNKVLFDLIKNHKWNDFKKYLDDNDDIDVNIRDSSNNYLINYAVMFNKIEIITILINNGSKLDITDRESRSILYIPIKYDYEDVLRLLLNFNKTHIGVSLIDIQDRNGNIPLHYAIYGMKLHYIDLLINAGSNINHKDKDGNNSLHLSVHSKNIDICKNILKNNIDINSRNLVGESSLHIACHLELEDFVDLLIDSDIDINFQDYDNEFTALSYTINRSNKTILRKLIKNGANPNLQDYYGNMSLHYCIMDNNIGIFYELVESKYIDINYNLYNTESKLPIHIVLQENPDNIIDYLKILLPKSNLNFQDVDGNTPLHYIVMYNLWKNYKDILEKKKLDIFVANNGGRSPIDLIDKNDKNEFIKMITESYIYTLRNKPYTWKESWENMCKKDMFMDKITDEEYKNISDKIKLDKDKEICRQVITNKLHDVIKNKKSKKSKNSHPIKKDLVVIDIDEGIKMNYCTFTGITLDVLIGVFYLLNKHKNICSTVSCNFMNNKKLCNYFKDVGIISDTKCEFLNFEIIWVYGKLYVADDFIKNVKNCINKKDKRFIIAPLGIELREGSHANYVIYDKKLNEFERFEPHGFGNPYKFNYNPLKLDNALRNRLEPLIKNSKYISPKEFLPKIGFQIFESYEEICTKLGDPKGFCAIWAIWYTDMRIKYADLDRKILIKELIKTIKNNHISFRNMIRNYSSSVIIKRDEILDKAGIDINDWLNDTYTEDQQNMVINELISIIKKFN